MKLFVTQLLISASLATHVNQSKDKVAKRLSDTRMIDDSEITLDVSDITSERAIISPLPTSSDLKIDLQPIDIVPVPQCPFN